MNENSGKPEKKDIIVTAIIPARGRSKRLPRKNLKELNGIPLITYSILNAKNVAKISNIFVSTEDKEIYNVSLKYGAQVINRPDNLAQDQSSSMDVILHAIEYLETDKKIFSDIIILLQPTSPLRSDDDLRESLDLFIDNNCESLISVTKNPHPPHWSFKIEDNQLIPLMGIEYFNKRSQELPSTYFPNGAIFISKTEIIKDEKTFYSHNICPYIMSPERSVDIDTIDDFNLAEIYLRNINNPAFPI